MPTIRFTKAYVVRDGSGTEYADGDVETMSDASCEHFVRRGVAEYVKRGRQSAEAAAPADDQTPAGTRKRKRSSRKKAD